MKFTIPIAICLICLVGCDLRNEEKVVSPRQVTPKDVLKIRAGIDIQELSDILGDHSRHQFSLRQESNDFYCLSYSFGKPFIYYYFLFRNKKLEKVCVPPPFDVDKEPFMDTYREIKKPLDPEKRAETVLSASGFFGEGLLSSLRKSPLENKESFDITPAFFFTGIFILSKRDEMEIDYERNRELAVKFGSAKVSLGDSEKSLLEAYGKPMNERRCLTDGCRIYQFGSNEVLNINPALRFSNLTVIVQGGVITRIYSNDFFDLKSQFGL